MKDKKPYNILIVEDNPGDLLIIKEYLFEEILSPKITGVKSYKEANDALVSSAKGFDIILLDLSLPDKDGDSLINEILSHEKVCCPVIVLTGYTDISFSRKSISLGVSDYLIKDDLNATILYKSILYSIERWQASKMLQESEKKYATLFNMSPQPMWVYDIETLKILQVNDAALTLYGYNKIEFLQLSVLDLNPDDENGLLQQALDKADGKDQVFSGVFTQLKKNGDAMEVEFYSSFLYLNGRAARAVAAIDITERKLTESRVTQAIIKAQEDERYEIGCELHDNVCQILAGSMLNLSILSPKDEAEKELLARGVSYIKLASDEIRNLSHRLAPAFFDDDDLETSFNQLLSSFNLQQRFDIDLEFSNEFQDAAIARELQLNLYRILQEQLNNIVKHSAADTITVSVGVKDKMLTMEITDNGRGFNTTDHKPGIGFANIKRRVDLFSGKFTVSSSPGAGCKVRVAIPIEKANEPGSVKQEQVQTGLAKT